MRAAQRCCGGYCAPASAACLSTPYSVKLHPSFSKAVPMPECLLESCAKITDLPVLERLIGRNSAEYTSRPSSTMLTRIAPPVLRVRAACGGRRERGHAATRGDRFDVREACQPRNRLPHRKLAKRETARCRRILRCRDTVGSQRR